MEYEFILRIFVAALLGGLIGLEREYRAKEAGFRTHFLVALGAALFMIVSAYGFGDSMTSDLHRWDVSRVASQVVSWSADLPQLQVYGLLLLLVWPVVAACMCWQSQPLSWCW